MPAGSRVRANNVFGLTTDNPLTAGAVAMNSAGLANLPAVILGSQHAIITLDPLRVNGAPEIIVVTAHTAAATIATITRAAYGTVARSHPQGTMWMHTPVDEDYREVLTSLTRPSDPYRGQHIFETDTNRMVSRSTADAWQQDGFFFDPPACRVGSNAVQLLGAGVWNTIAFNVESFDTANMHDNAVNNSRITIPVSGLYLFNASVEVAAITGIIAMGLRVNGAGAAGPTHSIQGHQDGAAQTAYLHYGDLIQLTAGNWVDVVVLGGGTNSVASVSEGRPNFSAVWVGRGN